MGRSTEFAARAKAVWARLIRKVYETDPLKCPWCKGPMRVIALIEDSGVIRRILESQTSDQHCEDAVRPHSVY